MAYKYNPFTGEFDRVLNDTSADQSYPVTPYVVGPAGQAGYQTIQAACDAANAAGGGIVVVQPGTYTEDLTLYDAVHIMGLTFADAGGGVTIVGIHTPPLSGGFSFNYVQLESATHIFNSAAAGTCHLIIGNAAIIVTNGYTFNVPNWTGKLETYDVNDRGSTHDGFINNTGGSEIAIFSAAVGAGTSNVMTLSGSISIFDCAVAVPMECVGNSIPFLEYNAHLASITFSDASAGEIVGCEVDAQIIMNSSNPLLIATCTVDTLSNPAIDGTGTGALAIGGIDFILNSSISSSLTVTGRNTYSGTYKSDYTDHGVILGQGSTTDMVATAAGTNGQLLIGGTGVDPAFADLTSTGATITITAGSNTLNVEAGAGVPTSFTTDSGTATPAANILDVVGGTNMNTAGATNVLTINLDGDVLGLTDLTVDNLELNGNTLSTTDVNGSLSITPNGTGGVIIPTNLTLGETVQDITFTINGSSIDAVAAVHTSGVTDLGGFVTERHSDTAAFGAHTIYLRSRGTEGAATVVADNDALARLVSAGYDGTDYAQSAEIRTEVDGTPGADDMPGRIIMLTSPDGTQVPVEGLRLDSSQIITLANPLPVGSGGTGASSFTTGSVIFMGASTLAEDNSNFFWDDTNNRLGLGITTPLDTFHVVGAMELDHTSTEADDHALEIVCDAAGFGDVKALDIDYITGTLAAGDEEEIILVNIDESASTGGSVAGYQVLTTEEGSASIYGYTTGININPVLHNSGTFGDIDNILNIAVDVTAALASGGAGNITTFVADNDTMTFGEAAKWNEMEFILDTPASGAGIAPTYEFSTGGAGFTAFTPADGTNGFRNTGAVLWIEADLSGWATNASGRFEIRITRTRNTLSTVPIMDEVQLSSTTEFIWDSSGDVNINSLSLVTALTVANGGTGATTLTDGGILLGSGTGAITATGQPTNGQLLVGSTGVDPVLATLTAGTGITVTNGAGSITIDSTAGGVTWNEETGTSATMVVDNGYIANNAGLVTLTLPATASVGDLIQVDGKGAGGWLIAQNAGQTVHFLAQSTTTGAGGSLASTTQYDCVTYRCITANTTWVVETVVGNLTVV